MAGHLPDYADLHPVTGTLLQQLDHLAIAYFHVVNQKFLFGSFDEIGELFASIQWTDQEAGRTRFIGTPLAVTVEQIFSFLDELLVVRDECKAAAAFGIDLGEIEREQM